MCRCRRGFRGCAPAAQTERPCRCPRVLRGLRVVAEELLQNRLRHGDAGDLGGLELELAVAVLRRQHARRRSPAACPQVAERIEPAALLLLADGVEVDDRSTGDAAVAERVQHGFDDADRDLIAVARYLQVRIHLGVGDRRVVRAGRTLDRGVLAVGDDLRRAWPESDRRPAWSDVLCATSGAARNREP